MSAFFHRLLVMNWKKQCMNRTNTPLYCWGRNNDFSPAGAMWPKTKHSKLLP